MSSQDALRRLYDQQSVLLGQLRSAQDLREYSFKQRDALQMQIASEPDVERQAALREEVRKQEIQAADALKQAQGLKQEIEKTELLLQQENQKQLQAREEQVKQDREIEQERIRQEQLKDDLRKQEVRIAWEAERILEFKMLDVDRDRAGAAQTRERDAAYEKAAKEREDRGELAVKVPTLELKLEPGYEIRAKAAEEARREVVEREYKELEDKRREAFERRHDALGTSDAERAEKRGYLEAVLEEQRVRWEKEERERAERAAELIREQERRNRERQL